MKVASDNPQFVLQLCDLPLLLTGPDCGSLTLRLDVDIFPVNVVILPLRLGQNELGLLQMILELINVFLVARDCCLQSVPRCDVFVSPGGSSDERSNLEITEKSVLSFVP